MNGSKQLLLHVASLLVLLNAAVFTFLIANQPYLSDLYQGLVLVYGLSILFMGHRVYTWIEALRPPGSANRRPLNFGPAATAAPVN